MLGQDPSCLLQRPALERASLIGSNERAPRLPKVQTSVGKPNHVRFKGLLDCSSGEGTSTGFWISKPQLLTGGGVLPLACPAVDVGRKEGIPTSVMDHEAAAIPVCAAGGSVMPLPLIGSTAARLATKVCQKSVGISTIHRPAYKQEARAKNRCSRRCHQICRSYPSMDLALRVAARPSVPVLRRAIPLRPMLGQDGP